MSTTDVADDLERMRQAVGDERLNFFGVSYGSYLGALYANRYPQNSGAIVVDAVLDPVDWATGRGRDRRPVSARLDSDVGAQATLDEFFRLCDEVGPERCAFSGDSAARYAALYATLEAEPILLELEGIGPIVLDHQLLVAASLGPLYSTFQWPLLAILLAELEAVAAGAPMPPTAGAPTMGRLREVVEVPDYVGSFAQTVAVICADGKQPRRASAWLAASDASVGYFGPLWTWLDGPCASWNADTSRVYRGPFDKQTADPVLIMNTTFDPATDISGARALRAEMPNSRLVTVEGWGHATIGLSLCAEEIRTRYFLTREVPAEDVTCQQDLPVFFDLGPEPEPPAGDAEVGVLGDAQAEALLQEAEEVLDPELAELLRRREVVLEHAGSELPATATGAAATG
jgi:pimeloyl-ACP methyl ester carboxylesterase